MQQNAEYFGSESKKKTELSKSGSFSGGDGWLCACVQHLWKGKEALQARDGSQCKSVRHRPRSCATHRLLPSMLLTVMMAGCVLAAEPLEEEESIASKRSCKFNSVPFMHHGADVIRCSLRASCAAWSSSCREMMAGCVLVCSTSGWGRKHCKQEMAANASLCVIAHRPRSRAAHRLLPSLCFSQ